MARLSVVLRWRPAVNVPTGRKGSGQGKSSAVAPEGLEVHKMCTGLGRTGHHHTVRDGLHRQEAQVTGHQPDESSLAGRGSRVLNPLRAWQWPHAAVCEIPAGTSRFLP